MRLFRETGLNGCGDDHGIIYGKAITLRYAYAEYMHVDIGAYDIDKQFDGVEKPSNLCPGKLVIPAQNIGDFVEDLNAGDATFIEQSLRDGGFSTVGRHQAEKDIAVQEFTWHSLHPDRM